MVGKKLVDAAVADTANAGRWHRPRCATVYWYRSSPSRPNDVSEETFSPVAEEVLGRIMQMADNAGGTDEHRALNYLATRYPAIYATALTSTSARSSALNGHCKVMDVVFPFKHRQTDVTKKYFARVDVTEESKATELPRGGKITRRASN